MCVDDLLRLAAFVMGRGRTFSFPSLRSPGMRLMGLRIARKADEPELLPAEPAEVTDDCERLRISDDSSASRSGASDVVSMDWNVCRIERACWKYWNRWKRNNKNKIVQKKTERKKRTVSVWKEIPNSRLMAQSIISNCL